MRYPAIIRFNMPVKDELILLTNKKQRMTVTVIDKLIRQGFHCGLWRRIGNTRGRAMMRASGKPKIWRYRAAIKPHKYRSAAHLEKGRRE